MHANRQADRQTGRMIDYLHKRRHGRQADRPGNRWAVGQIDRLTDKQTDQETDGQSDRLIDLQTSRLIKRQTEGLADLMTDTLACMQTDRQTDRLAGQSGYHLNYLHNISGGTLKNYCISSKTIKRNDWSCPWSEDHWVREGRVRGGEGERGG